MSSWIPTRGFTLWFTGLPRSGKSTISRAVYQSLLRLGVSRCELLDGDVVRTHISQGLGFSKLDRDTNILRIGWIAQLLTKHGVPTLVAAISPYRETRKQVREMVIAAGGPNSFIEVYVRCPLEECIRRDTQGLYARARRGEIKGMTGIDDPYEEPEGPEIILETARLDLESEVRTVLQYLESRGLIKGGKLSG
jgi:adenylylsulfate kinase